ncbi:MAG: hypothetical protein ACYDBA_08440 [Sulfuricaulis sp.]
MRSSFSVWVLTAMLLTAVSTSACAQEPANNSPASLVVYPKGEDVRYRDKDGAWWVYYNVQADYPAEDVLRFIKDALERQSWQPLKKDILNPDLPSSHATGWGEFVDGRTSPKTQVHQWLAQWKNSRGDVVWYELRYRHPVGTSAIPKTVSVIGTYYPANIVEQQLKWAEAERKNNRKIRIHL